jgi:hypothetical protein
MPAEPWRASVAPPTTPPTPATSCTSANAESLPCGPSSTSGARKSCRLLSSRFAATSVIAMKTPIWCRRRAAEIGRNAAAVIGSLPEVGALFRLRSPKACSAWPTRTGTHGRSGLQQGHCRRRSVLPHHRGMTARLKTEPPPPRPATAAPPRTCTVDLVGAAIQPSWLSASSFEEHSADYPRAFRNSD